MAIYTLHEYAFINTDPKKVASATDKPYETNSKGTTIIDVNKDLTYSRSLISLHTTKSTQDKFNQIIDIEFQDFIKPVSNSPAIFLENQISALQSNNTTLAGARDKLIKDNEGLKRINDRLKDELEREPRKLINAVSDTMFVGGILYSDALNNKLLSEDRTHIAVIQPLGNFVIYKSSYDEFGESIGDAPITIVLDTGENEYDVALPAIFKLDQFNGLQVARTFGFGRLNKAPATLPANSIKSTGKVVLDSNGILNLYSDSTTILWSSFVNTFTRSLNGGATEGGSLINPVAAAAAQAAAQAAYAATPAAIAAAAYAASPEGIAAALLAANQAEANNQGLSLEAYMNAVSNGSKLKINIKDIKDAKGFNRAEAINMLEKYLTRTNGLSTAENIVLAGYIHLQDEYISASNINHTNNRAAAYDLYNEIRSKSTNSDSVDAETIKIIINGIDWLLQPAA